MSPESPPTEEKTPQDFFDINPVLERIPPIEGIFDANKEVGGLLVLPKAERGGAVAEFKSKLARQREAWAVCRTSIEDQIEFYPETPKEGLMVILEEFGANYGFPEPQQKVAESCIDRYMEMHERVTRLRERYPDNAELIKVITGVKFNQSDTEDMEVELGPMSVEIVCPGFNAGRIYERSKDPIVGFRFGGFASVRYINNEPTYLLVVNRDYEESNPPYHTSTTPHEREHTKNRVISQAVYGTETVHGDVLKELNSGIRGFFRHRISEDLLGFERTFAWEAFKEYERAKDPERKQFFLNEYMRLMREHALNRAKDELIAMEKEREAGFERMTYNIFVPSVDDAYDYLKKVRERGGKQNDSVWQETAQRLLVDEYKEIIDQAISSFDRLMYGGRYSVAETIATLSDRRLADWPRTVRRMLEERALRDATKTEEPAEAVSAII